MKPEMSKYSPLPVVDEDDESTPLNDEERGVLMQEDRDLEGTFLLMAHVSYSTR